MQNKPRSEFLSRLAEAEMAMVAVSPTFFPFFGRFLIEVPATREGGEGKGRQD